MWFDKVEEVLSSAGLDPSDPATAACLWNCDETAFCTSVSATKLVVRKSTKMVHKVGGGSGREYTTVYLLQLYLTMVRPHLEYASPVWNPSTHKQVKMIEDVEKFAIKVVTRRWDAGYQELLNMVNIPSIESRRLQSCMCTLYKIVHSLCYFPPDIISQRPSFSKQSDRQFLLH